MTFHASGFRTTGIMGIPSATSEPGNVRQTHTYVTNDDRAAVETSGYFAALLTPKNKVRTGDQMDITFDVDGSPDRRSYTLIVVTGTSVTLKPMGDDKGAAPRAVVPTSDGLTTGLILDTDEFVEATSAGANNILTLPLATAETRGREILIWVVPSTNCELRTPASANQTINNVACGSSANEALLTHSQLYVARQHLATGWLLQAFTALGAVATAIVPDA
jgi:hypothetical protein